MPVFWNGGGIGWWVLINYYRYVDAHYFGYMDEEDGQVLPLEKEAESKARAEALDNYKMDRELEAIKKGEDIDDWDKEIYFSEAVKAENEDGEKEDGEPKIDDKVQVVETATGEKTIRAAHVPVPTQVNKQLIPKIGNPTKTVLVQFQKYLMLPDFRLICQIAA